jgi:hypothetical protein
MGLIISAVVDGFLSGKTPPAGKKSDRLQYV